MRNNPIILQIGLTQYEPAWEMLLRQIGIPHKVFSADDLLQADFSVLIINSTIDHILRQKIEDFIKHGGTALYTIQAVQELKNRSTTTAFVSSVPPTRTNYYQFSGILDLYSKVVYFQNNDFVELERSGDGWKLFLGIDIGIVLSSDSKRKNFFRNSGRMPNEVVAKRSKGTLRELVFSLLKTLYHLQQIPFVHQWYFPGSEPTIFTMRVDSDKGSLNQIERIYEISNSYGIPTTWFLDVKSHESWLSYFRKFEQQEIGVHCYEHVLYRSTLLNKENFEKALTLLRKNSFEPKGITAPTGGWNKEFAEAIESLGFHYSSEFAYDYDNLPSYPIVKGSFFSLLQIPIHPVCIGTMLRARMDDAEMSSYFRSIIDTKYLLNEPICLYHHPTHGHNGVFEEVFRYINERNIVKLSYAQFADWWKQRTSNPGLLRFSDGILTSLSGETGTQYRIIQPDNSESITAINERLELNSLSYQHSERMIEPNEHIMRSRSFDPGHIVQNALDWWMKTTE